MVSTFSLFLFNSRLVNWNFFVFVSQLKKEIGDVAKRMEFKCENFSFLFISRIFLLEIKKNTTKGGKYENSPEVWHNLGNGNQFQPFRWLREQHRAQKRKENHPHRITGSGFSRAFPFYFFLPLVNCPAELISCCVFFFVLPLQQH